jgi:hypothetical protein
VADEDLSGVTVLDDAGGTDIAVGSDLVGGGFEEARQPVKTALTLIMVDGDEVFASLPCRRHHYCSFGLLDPKKTLDLSLSDRKMAL